MDRGSVRCFGAILVTDDCKDTEQVVERLMGTKAEARFDFIEERAEFADDEMLDV